MTDVWKSTIGSGATDGPDIKQSSQIKGNWNAAAWESYGPQAIMAPLFCYIMVKDKTILDTRYMKLLTHKTYKN